jgi:hypothetical protein
MAPTPGSSFTDTLAPIKSSPVPPSFSVPLKVYFCCALAANDKTTSMNIATSFIFIPSCLIVDISINHLGELSHLRANAQMSFKITADSALFQQIFGSPQQN